MSAYDIESIDYTPGRVLPPNDLFENPNEVAALVEETRTSILESQ